MRSRIALAAVLTGSLLAQGCARHQLIHDGKVNERAVARLERETAEARGLPFLRPVEARVLDDDEVQAYFEARISASPAYFEAQTKVAHKLGILPGHVHLADLYKKSYAKNAAALYEREGGGRMLLFGDAFPLYVRWPLELIGFLTATDWLNELIVSHELVHALQDQHFDLDKVLPARLYAENEDAALAHKSIVESEANLVSYAHVFKVDLDSFAQRNLLLEYLLGTSWMTLALALVANQGSASYYTKVLTLQYFYGMGFVQHVANESGGYRGVDRAYLAGLPDSTEQLLWPEKLSAASWDPPKPLAPLDDTALSGWTLLDENTFGELSLRTLLEQHMSGARAKEAARGWGGDRYLVAEREERVLLAWRFLSDSAEDARELFDAYERVLAGKYPDRLARRVTKGPGDDGWRVWRITPSVNDGARTLSGVPTRVPELVAMRIEGERVVVLEGLDPATWLEDAEGVWRATRVDESVTVPAKPPMLDPAAKLPSKVKRRRPGLERAFLLSHHQMELRLGLEATRYDDALSLRRYTHVRWGFRPNLELSMPLALSVGARTGPLLSVVTAGAPGVLEDLGLFSLSVTEALLFDDVAVALQARAQADVPGWVPWEPGVFVGGALGASVMLFERMTVSAGVGYERESVLLPSHSAVVDRLVLGSALRRGFAEQPVLELALIAGVHLWANARLELDPANYVIAEQRYAGGLSLYF